MNKYANDINIGRRYDLISTSCLSVRRFVTCTGWLSLSTNRNQVWIVNINPPQTISEFYAYVHRLVILNSRVLTEHCMYVFSSPWCLLKLYRLVYCLSNLSKQSIPENLPGKKIQFNLPKYYAVVCINPQLQYWQQATPRFVAIWWGRSVNKVVSDWFLCLKGNDSNNTRSFITRKQDFWCVRG